MVASADISGFGVGAYSVAQAARLLRTPPNTLRYWIDTGHGVVRRYYDREREVLSFAELMELHFIKLFRDEEVSLQAIRAAAQVAAKRYGTDYPFAMKRFDTDGRTIFATLEKEGADEELVEDLRRGQYVFAKIVRPFFKKLDYEDAEVARYWPLGKRQRIVLDPQRRLGQPLDDRTGVPTSALYAATHAGQGQSVAEVADWYGVPVAAVRAAVAFERSIKR